ncbi:MAG TPA: class I SAM-dependent DNA methyltransferase [Trueperaceae bacterium]
MTHANNLSGFIWGVADLLRGPFKQSEYGRVILPFTVLRRLECVLEPTREAVLEALKELEGSGVDLDLIVPGVAGAPFYNTSRYTLGTLGATSTRANLEDYVSKFSGNARAIFEHFAFDKWLEKLEATDLLYAVAQKFANIDLHPDRLSNYEMGLAFEHLIHKFAESANDTAGEHFTPRDVVRLTTTLVVAPDHDALGGEGVIRTVYDPTAGTGGFLSAAIEQVAEWNPDARLVPYSQELNAETYAIQVADKLIQGYDTRNLKLGNTLADDQLPEGRYHYGLSNPPYGADWKAIRSKVEAEHKLGYAGRFGPGLPRVSDGSMLFLLHLLSKRRPRSEGGSRFGIVLSGSPLFTGGAGSGESEIRRWVLEEDLLEAIVALPTDLFYNTGIATYVWVLSNAKEEARRGKVQLIDASDTYAPMRKGLGSKRKYLTDEQIAEIARFHAAFEETPKSKIVDTSDFGYRRITIERPLKLTYTPNDSERLAALREEKAWQKLAESERRAILDALATLEAYIPSRKRFHKELQVALKSSGVSLNAAVKKLLQKHLAESDEAAEVCTSKGKPEPDPSLRDYENVSMGEDVFEYFEREVRSHVPDAWIDEGKRDPKDGEIGIVGYEIPFNRHFYVYQPPRPLEEIDANLRETTERIKAMIERLSA